MKPLDANTVKQAAQGRWGEIISTIAGIDPAILDTKHHPCPRPGCGGTDRFRAFDDFAEAGGVYCNQCHNKSNSDGFATIQWMTGCKFAEALRNVANHLGVVTSGEVAGIAERISDEEFLAMLCRVKQMPIASAKVYGAEVTMWGSDRVVVFPVYGPRGDKSGHFAISPTPSHELLRKGKLAKGSKQGLFLPHDERGKPQLPQPKEEWLLVEGTKDAAALHGLGYHVVGLPTSNMNMKFAPLFKGVAVVVVPDLDAAGQKGADQTASRLKDVADSVKIARLPGEVRESDGIDCRDVLAGPDGESLLRTSIRDSVIWGSGKDQSPDDKRPKILISTDEYVTNDAAAKELAHDDELFQRGGQLVCVAVGDDGSSIHRAAHRARIVPVTKPRLREILTRPCRFAIDSDGDESAVHPPELCTKAIHDRGYWPGVRNLHGVTASPILRPDGSVLTKPGFDPLTGLYMTGELAGVEVSEAPTQNDARRAVQTLLDVVCDFPFERPEHRAAWLSALLTPLARPAINGPTPLHLIDSNARGSGKTLSAENVSIITTGDSIARMANPSDDDEARKRITALAISGDTLVLIDNVNGGLGCSALEAALTGTRWQDRVLGASQMFDLPLLVTWLASGNNVVLRADTSRRALHIRLKSDLESPESRTDFRYPNVRAYVQANRHLLLSAALTILRAWFVAGRPQATLPAWGSFEDSTSVVRQAIVFAGQPDPAATRQEIVASADRDGMALRAVMEHWRQIDPSGTGLTASQIVEALKPLDMKHTPPTDSCLELREAFLDLCPPIGHATLPSVRQIGSKLSHLRGRVAGGRAIDCQQVRGGFKLWRVTDVSQKPQFIANSDPHGDSDDCGDSLPGTPNAPAHAHARPHTAQGKTESPESSDSSPQMVSSTNGREVFVL